MNLLKTLLVTSLALTGFNVSHGANVVITSLAAGPGGEAAKQVVTSANANVPQGSIVRVGHFDLTSVGGSTAILTVGLFPALEAIFTPLGENAGSAADGTSGPVVVNAAGGIGGSIQNVDNAFMPAGRALYAWVFAQPTPNAAATQWTIFRDSTWLMPAGIGSINLQTWQIDQASEVFRGTLDLGANRIAMAVIPEPGSALLGMIGLVVAWRRRRA
jgi:PEP-CTERM motif